MENNEQNVGVETPDVATTTDTSAKDAEIKKLKDALSKSNSENAEWKRKYNSKLTEEEQSKAREEERDAYTKSLEKQIQKIELSAELSKGINDNKVLNGILDDILEGNHVNAVKQFNAYIETRVANAIKEHDDKLLKDNPTPPPTTATGGITKEQFDKMTVAEKSALYLTDKDTYDKFTK